MSKRLQRIAGGPRDSQKKRRVVVRFNIMLDCRSDGTSRAHAGLSSPLVRRHSGGQSVSGVVVIRAIAILLLRRLAVVTSIGSSLPDSATP